MGQSTALDNVFQLVQVMTSPDLAAQFEASSSKALSIGYGSVGTLVGFFRNLFAAVVAAAPTAFRDSIVLTICHISCVLQGKSLGRSLQKSF